MACLVAGCGDDKGSTESKTQSTPTVEETAPTETTSAGGSTATAERTSSLPAPGECKQALTRLATAEEAFGKALDSGKPLAERKSLGQQVLKFKGQVDSAC
jgi:hypothetical protein